MQIKSLIHLTKFLQDENTCREFLEEIRWQGEPICPHCGCQSEGEKWRHYKLKSGGKFKGLYKCRYCRKRFTVMTKSMFEGSHVSLRNWLLTIYLFISDKKGMSSVQIGKYIGVTQKTAWFMLNRIRHNIKDKIVLHFKDETQVDETYIGGKNRKRRGIKGTQGRSTKIKTPVMGLLSNSAVYAKVVPDTEAETLKPIIYEYVQEGTTIVSDGLKSYKGLSKFYHHEVVLHSQYEYVNKNGFHTNGIEGFWSQLKRGLNSTYHFCLRKHLSKYCDEFAFRYNTRYMDDGLRFVQFVASAYKRLKYQELII